MKECRSCKIKKDEQEFTKRTSNLDGLYSYCKECTRSKNKLGYSKNKERYTESNRIYKDINRIKLNEDAKKYYYKNRHLQLQKRAEYREKNKEIISIKESLKRISDEDRFEKNRLKHLKWSKDNRERLNKWQKDWYQKNKEKRRAHVTLSRAIVSGKIIRPDLCSQCGKKCKPDGHHEDYNKPLNVIWLCKTCHSRKSPRTKLHVPPERYNNLCKTTYQES